MPVTVPLSLRFDDGRLLVVLACLLEVVLPVRTEAWEERFEEALSQPEFAKQVTEEPIARFEVTPPPESEDPSGVFMMESVPAPERSAGVQPVVMQHKY